ncbi:MAG: hypothetical protein ABW003_24585 [Microvirga sp.]
MRTSQVWKSSAFAVLQAATDTNRQLSPIHVAEQPHEAARARRYVAMRGAAMRKLNLDLDTTAALIRYAIRNKFVDA